MSRPFLMEWEFLRLSDAYLEKMEHPMLELEVKVININLPSGHRLLEHCRPMYEYSWFIQQIKSYLWDGLTRDAAITQAVKDCLEEGVLVEFMKNHGSEVANMLYTQWNYDEAVSVEREEAYEDGREAGKAIGIAIGIAEGRAEGKAYIIFWNIWGRFLKTSAKALKSNRMGKF